MNLITKFSKFRYIIVRIILGMVLFSIVSYLLFLSIFWWDSRQNENEPMDSCNNTVIDVKGTRRTTYEEMSPDGEKKIIRYEIPYNSEFYSDNYNDYNYFNNNIIIAIITNIGTTDNEHYLFTGNYNTGFPHWLGNNYVFFTTHCGSSCQGLMLLDTKLGQRWLGGLSSLTNSNSAGDTYFHDWFGQNFSLGGGVIQISGKLENNKPYLIFDMGNEKGVESGQKRFLFTGDTLTEVTK